MPWQLSQWQLSLARLSPHSRTVNEDVKERLWDALCFILHCRLWANFTLLTLLSPWGNVVAVSCTRLKWCLNTVENKLTIQYS